MRMMPSRYLDPRPARAKPNASQIAHISAPLKGLSLSSKLTTGDPLTAPILTNFNVENDRISARAGFRLVAAMTDVAPIERLIPWYGGGASTLLAAINNTLCNALGGGAAVQGGFTSNDWSWTSFSNLNRQDFTVMVNGHNGVWSWNGLFVPGADPAAVPVQLSNTNPAKCTVLPGDLEKFQNGMTVVITGADVDHAAANGSHVISNVGLPALTFTLTGVDLSAATDPQTSGVQANAPPTTPITKETIVAPSSATWIDPNNFNIVLSHMNRLWFADTANLAVYYLPVQQKSCVAADDLKLIPLNAVFRRGGTIAALATWTIDGGMGLDDQLVIFSTNGECAIYGGTDPDSDFALRGVFRFDAPMSKHSVINFGGDLYVLISTGLVPMSTMLRAEDEQLGQYDRNVVTTFREHSTAFRDRPGWQVIMNPSSGRAICNVPHPQAKGGYHQFVRQMPSPVWAQWEGVPARSWAWISPYLYFGNDKGQVFQMHPSILNDNGDPIRVDVQPAWSQFKTPAVKHFKLVRVYAITDAVVRPMLDIKREYDTTPPENQPDNQLTEAGGSLWDEADWDLADWAPGPRPVVFWNGVGRLGRVAAPRLVALVRNCEFAITGWDIVIEPGSII